MTVSNLHHQELDRRWAEEQRQLEGRRQVLVGAASSAARALRECRAGGPGAGQRRGPGQPRTGLKISPY